MSRPTLREAIKVAHEAARRPGMEWAAEKIAIAVADLFGGFAPELVEVPELTALRHEDAAIEQFFAFGLEPTDSDGREASVYLEKEQIEAACARSNAWEEIKGLLLCQFDFLDGRESESWAETVIKPKLKEIVDLMARPEFGVGPK